MLQEHSTSAAAETVRRPVPNVPTGTIPVVVDDPGSVAPYSMAGHNLAAGHSRHMHQEGVQLPADVYVRTNEGFQATDIGKNFAGLCQQ